MKRLLLLPFLIISGSLAAQQLSDKAEISVITCGPYQGELYSAFGHSAIRVYDPVNQINYAYNYGVFDFDQPNFYLNFARGYLYYKLGVYDYNLFRDYYIYHNRYVHEQFLNLNQEEKQKLFDYLEWNALPENQNYRYDYFYNNCATKVRDVLITVFGDRVHFDGSYVTTDYTIRDLTDLYLHHQPWGDLGIDICLGLPMDKKADPFEYMFLPDYIESGFDHATIKNDSTTIPLVKSKVAVYESRNEVIAGGLPHPLLFFSIIAAITLAISIFDFKRKKLSYWLDGILFAVSGSIGLLLLLLWVATDHKAAANNFNLLWAMPTHLVAVFAFIKNPKWLKSYFNVVSTIYSLVLIFWFLLPQMLNIALMPIVMALMIRSFTQYWLRRATQQQIG